MYCEYALSRIVFPTFRSTSAWMEGFSTISSGTITETNDDFSEPRPPLRS